MPETPIENVTFFHNGRHSSLPGVHGKARMGFVKIEADPSTHLFLWQTIEAVAETLSITRKAIHFEPHEVMPQAVRKALESGHLLAVLETPDLGFYGFSAHQEMSESWYRRHPVLGVPITIAPAILHRFMEDTMRWSSDPAYVMAPFAGQIEKLCPVVDGNGYCLTEPGIGD